MLSPLSQVPHVDCVATGRAFDKLLTLVDRLAADDRSTSALTLLRSAMASLSAGWRRGTIRVLEVSGSEGGAVKLC
jgi:hypothetical protein